MEILMASTSPSAATVSLKLMIDPKSNRLLFAEAGKDFVDFLFYIMSLPVGTVTRLLGKQATVGCIGNIYGSIENLDDSYFLSAPEKDMLLRPMLTNYAANVAFLLPSMQSSTHTNLYKCASRRCMNVTFEYNSRCLSNSTHGSMYQKLTFVNPTNGVPYSGGDADGGFVKGGVAYMIMDDLTVTSVSGTTIITLLKEFNVKDVSDLEEKVIAVGVNEGVELLKASMQTKTVLSSVFLVKKESSVKSEPLH
ncbi:Detected protein of unknown function [Hibiscus syriacus]|uniref:DUF674 domain-containing protein n=2 Tax=Hibiscus syriacus TaxID=106335 RepID=A0A6A2XVD7_HIBSY|nr:Detected protein of unknown function [Hibiscus syriacus]